MQRTIGMLAVLLVAQLLLAVGLSFTGPSLTSLPPDTPLIDLGGQTVDRLTIEGPDDQQVVLARQDGDWILPEAGNFPADEAKVNLLLERLAGLKRGLAVGTTGGAQKRFKVSDSVFERRVVLAGNDETLSTLYFGTSPGLRQVHARADGDDAVYTTEFGIYDAPVKPADWQDKGVLKIPQDEIQSIALADITLTRAPQAISGNAPEDAENKATGTIWKAAALQEGETVNQANAGALAQKLAVLTFGSVLGREERIDYGLETPALTLSVQRQGGMTIEYRLTRREQENDYVLKVSSRPEYFRLPGYTADALIRAAARDQLVVTATNTDAAGEDDAGQAAEATVPLDESGYSDGEAEQLMEEATTPHESGSGGAS